MVAPAWKFREKVLAILDEVGGGGDLSDFLTSLNELTLAEGDLIYASDADTAVTLAKGTAGQILTMNAGATAPEWDDPAAGPSSEFSDSVFRIQDNSDATKELAFQVSGIATGTTRTWNVPNVDLTFGAYAATLVNTADEAGFKAAVNLEIGTDVQAHSANLDEYAAVNPTAAGLALLDDADAAAQRATLDLEPGTDVQAYSAILASAAGLSLSAGDLIYATGASALARLGVGADGEVLTLASGVPSWAAGGGGGGTGWTLISSVNHGTGGTVATVDFTGISSTYSELFLRFWDVSHNDGSNRTIGVSVSHNNGSNYSSVSAVTPSGAGSGFSYFNGIAHFTGRHTPMVAAYYAGDNSGQVKDTASSTTPTAANNPTTGIARMYYVPEGQFIDAVRVAAAAGSLDLYNIELWGRE